jgi:hypothetical protein
MDMLSKLIRLIQRSNVIQRQRYVPSHEFKDASRTFNLLLRLVFLRCSHGRVYELAIDDMGDLACRWFLFLREGKG